MSVEKTTPVVVGVHQLKQKPAAPADALEAIELMTMAVSGALADTGAPSLAAKVDAIAVVNGAWKYTDPGRLIAERIGASTATTILSYNGGNTPQSLINHLSTRVQTGEIGCAVVVGAETIWSRRRQRRDGNTIPSTPQPDAEPDERFGTEIPMSTDFEKARGFNAPINYYPLFESAIRARLGETLDGHRNRVAELWADFNEVAVANDHAWSRRSMTAAEIRDPSPNNRMVGFPYTKAMNSNWDLDLAAAIVLCSASKAEQAGIEKSNWVFPWAGTDAHDTYAVSERRDLHSSPAITEAGKKLFNLSGIGPDDVAHVDLYSCFPSAVQVGAEALGLGFDRQLTQTGGLTFAGGPLNNYVTHSIATMTQRLRGDDAAIGLVTANGGYLTKHALGLYSTSPPPVPFRSVDVQEKVDQIESTPVDTTYSGPAVVEGYTVMNTADGPQEGLCALRTPNGARTLGQFKDDDDIESLMSTEHIGSNANIDEAGQVRLS